MLRKVSNVSVTFEDSSHSYIPNLKKSVQLSVITKCPEKYMLIDKETGEVYNGSSEFNPYNSEYCLWKKADQ